MKPKPQPKQPVPTVDLNIKRLLGKLDFSPDNVVEASAMNSVLFAEAIEYRWQCISKKNATKMALELVEVDTELRIRKDAKDAGDKITEGNIRALVCVDPGVVAAREEAAKAEALDEYSKLVCEAFRMRRDCLQIVKGMLKDDFRNLDALESQTDKMREARERLRERFPGGGE